MKAPTIITALFSLLTIAGCSCIADINGWLVIAGAAVVVAVFILIDYIKFKRKYHE